MVNDETRKQLVEAASSVRDKAYAPYSNFKVGAAVLTDDGSIFAGCNVENSSFGLTICAERVAISCAIAQGFQRISAVCVVSENSVAPCGACRQFINEFGPKATILLVNAADSTIRTVTTLDKLLPNSFNFDRESPFRS